MIARLVWLYRPFIPSVRDFEAVVHDVAAAGSDVDKGLHDLGIEPRAAALDNELDRTRACETAAR